MGAYGRELQPLVVTPKHRSIPITFWQVSFLIDCKIIEGCPERKFLLLDKDHTLYIYIYIFIYIYIYIYMGQFPEDGNFALLTRKWMLPHLH